MDKSNLFNDIKGVIFDLDGTLISSMTVWHDIDIQFFKDRGIPYPSDYQKAISHKSLIDMAIYTKERFNLKDKPEDICNIWLRMAEDAYAHKIKLKPHVKEVLEFVKEKGLKIGLATTTSSKLYLPCLENNGIKQFFSVMLNANDLKTDKSKPDIYLEVAKRLGTKPSETIVFEDIIVGITTAHNAGFRTVGVYDKTSEKDSAEIKSIADMYILDFSELLD